MKPLDLSLAIDEWNRRFGIAGLAQVIRGNGGLPKVRVSTPTAVGEIYLHGAQVTSWQPAGADELIFVSEYSHWEEGRAIRGGIPICFPWFRAKADDPQAPAHGFVRTKAWQLESILPEGDAVVVTLSTASDDATRKWWPHDFRLVHRITIGAELKLELTTTNHDSGSVHFEEALHAYHRVGAVEKIRILGLDGALFLDNTESNRMKIQQGDVVLTRQTDNAYLNTLDPLEIVDPVLQHNIQITKGNSLSTVVWNPWESGAHSLTDLGDEEWKQMVCVEASNILDCAVNLEPGGEHTLHTRLQVTKN